jgi:hypothetical protein
MRPVLVQSCVAEIEYLIYLERKSRHEDHAFTGQDQPEFK